MDFEEIFSFKKLDRDKGLAHLEKALPSMDESQVLALYARCKSALTADNWEAIWGGLAALHVLVRSPQIELTAVDQVAEEMRLAAMECLHHDECRVRQAAGELLGGLCRLRGVDVYVACRDDLITMIRNHMNRSSEHEPENDPLVEKLIHSHSNDADGGAAAAQIFHDTAGWRALETSMKCLQYVVEGCSGAFREHVSRELVELIFTSLEHTNRFVRETGYYVVGALTLAAAGSGKNEENMEIDQKASVFFDEFVSHLATGLADNWSQVRLAASVATRQLLSVTPPDASRIALKQLLSPLCLNRYYLAEGVRLYSQETWRQFVSPLDTQALVAANIEAVVQFDVSQTEADNHAVREAACHCIAELALKVDRSVVQPHVQALLGALMVCCDDDSWPVRDGACLAVGNLAEAYPDSCAPHMPKIIDFFFANLRDCIPSVRHGAALTIAKVVSAYGTTFYDTEVKERLVEGLSAVKDQPASSTDDARFAGLEAGQTNFGVAQRAHANDDAVHTDQTMYSCGSLAPKMKAAGGGCSSCQFRAPASPWEITDGCLHLLADLAQIAQKLPDMATKLAGLLPGLAESTRKRDYVRHVQLMESLCKRLPTVASSLGKRHFKPHLELFIEPVFYAQKCGCELTEFAATDCIMKLAQWLGPSILRGRLEASFPQFIDLFDSLNVNRM